MQRAHEFEDSRSVAALARACAEAAARAGRPLRFMEVCGTHTMAVARGGLRALFPEGVELISGPGCPVCVTPDSLIALAATIARTSDCTLATFGDMLRVPFSASPARRTRGACGNLLPHLRPGLPQPAGLALDAPGGSLEEVRASGGDVRMVYSTTDALDIARRESPRRVVFFAIGFETTAPTIAAALMTAEREGIKNFLVLPANRLIPPAMSALVNSGELHLDGFLCPGHVSVVIGPEAYAPFAARGLPCVIVGFEPSDVMQGVLMLINQAAEKRAEVELQYTRAVRPGGNPRAREAINAVFAVADGEWRGLGVIPGSALAPAGRYARFDAISEMGLPEPSPEELPTECRCGEVLRGVLRPWECPLFDHACTPRSPVGACMVSSEGSCAAAWRYRDFPAGKALRQAQGREHRRTGGA